MNFPGFVQPSYKQKRFNLSNKLQNNSNIYFLFLVKLLFFSFAKIQNSTFLNRMMAKKYAELPLFSTHSFEKHYHFCTLETPKSDRYRNAFG